MVEGSARPVSGRAGRSRHICADCVEACEGIFAKHERKNALLEKLPTPRELVAHLDDYIIGQDRVKRTLAVAVVNHYKRLLAGRAQADRRPRAQGRRGRQEQRPADRPDRLRQDGAGADPGPAAQRPVRHRRRHHADRGRLRRRGRREPDPQARPRGRLRHPRRRARDHLHRRDRQDRQDLAERLDHPRRLGRGGPAGPPEAARRDGRQRPAAGGPEAPRAAVPPGRHDQHPVHLRRDVRRPRGDHRQAARPEDDRLRPRATQRATRRSSATSWSPRSRPRTSNGSA